jgi:DNA-binding transcriptional LysR family regulator
MIRSMPLESLQVFCDLIRFRNFSATAKTNGLSQPTVTRIIHQLEERLGGPLIDRSKRPLQPTPLGQSYYEGCKDLLERYLELEASLRRDFAQRVMTVRVAAIYSVGLGDMGQFVRRFETEHPFVKVYIDYLHPDQVYERIREGTADLGLVSFPARSRELSVLPWREEEMVLACPPSHRLAQGESLSPSLLNGEKYVAFEQGLTIRRRVDRFLRDHGVSVEVVHEFDNIENIKKAVQVGSGVALLPEPTLRQERQAGTLRTLRLEGCRLVRPLAVIHRRQQRLGAAALGFLELLCPNRNGAHRNGEANGAPAPALSEPEA